MRDDGLISPIIFNINKKAILCIKEDIQGYYGIIKGNSSAIIMT